MQTFSRFALVSLASLGAAQASAFILIDSFTSGSYMLTVSSSSPSSKAVGSGLAGVLGGHRDVLLQHTSGVSTISANVNTTYGMQFFSAFALTHGSLTLQYDGNDGEPPTGPLNPGNNLNANFSGQDRFELRFPEVQPVAIRTTVASSTGTSTVLTNVPLGVNVTHNIWFADFAGVDFSSVGRVEFEFISNTATDFAIESIAAVPEPGTFLALTAGAAALASRRKRRVV